MNLIPPQCVNTGVLKSLLRRLRVPPNYVHGLHGAGLKGDTMILETAMLYRAVIVLPCLLSCRAYIIYLIIHLPRNGPNLVTSSCKADHVTFAQVSITRLTPIPGCQSQVSQ